MNFKKCLKRAELLSIENHILYGGETNLESSEKTYSERLNDSNKKVSSSIRALCTTEEEYEKFMECYDESAATIEDVYFEIGVIIGAKIGYQFREKMEQPG